MFLTCEPLAVSDRTVLLVDLLSDFPGPATTVPATLTRAVEREGLERLIRDLVDLRLVHLLTPYMGILPGLGSCAALLGAQTVIDAIAQTHIAELKALTADLDGARVPALVLKGVAIASLAYPTGPRPFSGDVDLLVRPEHVATTLECLDGHGYQTGLVVRSSVPVRLSPEALKTQAASPWFFGQAPAHTKLVRAQHLDHLAGLARAMFPFHVVVTRSEQVFLRPSFDVHYTLNTLTDDTGDGRRPNHHDWWADPISLTRDGVRFDSPRPAVLAWSAPYHLYLDVKLYRQMPWKLLADVVALCRADLVDGTELAAFAHTREAVRPAVHWVYRFLAEILGVRGLDQLVAATRKGDSPHATDFGDITPDLLGVESRFHLNRRIDG